MDGKTRDIHKAGHVAVILVTAIAVFLLYSSNLGGYWRGDDTALLSFAQSHALWDVFFVPEVWQQVSTANLTPWLITSFQIDHQLAGVAPAFYYTHHLLILSLLFVALYAFLALYMSRIWAFFGAATSLLGLPVATVAGQLMTRHYLEGMVFAVLCLYYFELAQRRQRSSLFFVSAFFYLMAVISKEIYVPVIMVLAISWWQWLQQGHALDNRVRIAGSVPYIAIALLYVAWRGYMLPGLSGGYSDSNSWTTMTYWRQVLNTFATFPRLLFGSSSIVFTIAAITLAGITALTKPRLLLLTLWIAGLVLLPLVPLVGFPGITTADRYLLLPWVVLCCSGAAMLAQVQQWLRPRMRGAVHVIAPAALSVVVPGVLLAQQLPLLRAIDTFNHQSDTQIRFAWDNGNEVAFIPDSYVAQTFWLLQGLQKMKQWAHPGADIPLIVLDDSRLDDTRPLYEYDGSCACMRDISDSIPQRRAALATQLRPEAPMAVQFVNQNGVLSWSITPADGKWEVLSVKVGKMQIPPQQPYLQTSIREQIDIQMKYTAAEGWISYSPVLQLLPDGSVLQWQRPSAATP